VSNFQQQPGDPNPRIDGWGFTDGDSIQEDTANAIAECGVPIDQARALVREYGPHEALTRAGKLRVDPIEEP